MERGWVLRWNDTSQVEATVVSLSAVESCICSELKGCKTGRCFARVRQVILRADEHEGSCWVDGSAISTRVAGIWARRARASSR
eukprot:2762385-Rhodomonas_salina.1